MDYVAAMDLSMAPHPLLLAVREFVLLIKFTAFDSIPHIFRRDCVLCPETTPSCPSCNSGEVCVQISATCAHCAYRKCVSASDSGSTTTDTIPSGSHSPSKGAIIGGVIGGVVFIAIATYLVWRFCIKTRRAAFIDTFEDELEETSSEKGGYPTSDARASIRTRESIASTVLTRASNVIPIAFIPGIIDSSGGHVPPVPPVPIPTQSPVTSPYSDRNGDTYFMPGDLRDSTYSGFSDDGASSTTGRSITNSLIRGSMASTIYPVINPAPAQTAHRARAAVVSVKSSGAATPVPAVPRIDYDKYGRIASKPQTQQTLDPPRTRNNEEIFSLNAMLATSSPQPAMPSGTIPSVGPSRLSTIGAGMAPRSAVPAHITAVIEEAARRASRQPTHGGLGSVRRDDSPFSDDHAIVDE